MEPRRQTIPVILLVKTAFQLLWQQRDDALRLGLVPTLLLFGGFIYGKDAIFALLDLLQAAAPAAMSVDVASKLMVLNVILLAAGSLLTVNWLRFLLLGPMGAVGVGLNIGRPHIRFFLMVIALSVVVPVVLFELLGLLAYLPAAFGIVIALLLCAAALVFVVRILPYLIGIAIGQPLTLMQSWQVSRGYAFGLAMSLILLQIPFMLGSLVVQAVLVSTGFTAMAPVGTLFIGAVTYSALWVCQANIMATTYRHMVGVRV